MRAARRRAEGGAYLRSLKSEARKVTVLPHDPAWARAFRNEARRIGAVLDAPLKLLHIGSTSVPGLAAKPIIDMLGVTPDLARIAKADPIFIALGYEPRGAFGIPGRLYYRRTAWGTRTHHLHIFQEGSDHIRRHLAFRDYLRTHAGDRAAYGALKTRLARAHPTQMSTYMDGKDAFIRALDRRIAGWPEPC